MAKVVYSIGTQWYELDNMGRSIAISSPSETSSEDVKEGKNPFKVLEDTIPGLSVGINGLDGSLMSLIYEATDYTSVIGTLPSTELKNDVGATNLLTKMDEKNKNTNSRLDKQNDLLLQQNNFMEASLILQAENNKTMIGLASALASLATDSRDLKDLTKKEKSSNINTNGSLKSHLDFELTGKIPKDPKDITMMDLFNNVDSTKLKDSADNDIIPIHVKAKKDAEKTIETKAMNETDFLDTLTEFFGFEDDDKTSFSDLNFESILDTDNKNPFKSIIDMASADISKIGSDIYIDPTKIEDYLASKGGVS